jgi:hypothetical protein
MHSLRWENRTHTEAQCHRLIRIGLLLDSRRTRHHGVSTTWCKAQHSMTHSHIPQLAFNFKLCAFFTFSQLLDLTIQERHYNRVPSRAISLFVLKKRAISLFWWTTTAFQAEVFINHLIVENAPARWVVLNALCPSGKQKG